MRQLRVFVLAAFALGFAAAAPAQSWPSKPIKIIIPFPPGDAADIMARLIGPKMTERMGQQIIVENRPGASGQIGLEILKNAPADGYTIGVGQGGNLVVAPHTYKKLPYDPLKDFAPVALLATNYLAVVANPNVPFKTAAEMIAWAKANPGRLTLATNGEGSFPHLAFENLAVMGGFKFQHIPYEGATQIITDVMGGQAQLGIAAYTSLSPHVLSGRVRLIAVTNPVRVPNKPDLPIFADAVPGYDSRGWFGYVAPAATPPEIVRKLNEEINRAMQQPDVSEKLVAAGLIIITEPPEFFGKMIKSDYAKYGELAREIGFERVDRLLPLMVSLGLLSTLLLFGVLYSLFSSRRRAVKIAAQMTKDLKAVSHRLVEVQEAERRLLATELHDRAGPSLTALGINLSMVANSLPVEAEPRLAARLEECAALVVETVEAMRDVMRELRPLVLDDYGLVAALRSLATRFSRRTGIHVVFDASDSQSSLPKTIDLALFRIVQEALNNVAKHSKAHCVETGFSRANGAATLRVSDDGVGFDPRRIEASNPGLGLIIMRERAEAVGAKFGLKASPGAGVQVLVESPSGNATA
jgi:tripartite-type tricarboxylate transporter receptor subunit TctC